MGVHDGTQALPASEWESTGDGVWKTHLPKGTQVYQLWMDGEMMTPARWPNALWSDKSVFDWKRWSKFDGGATWGPFPSNTPDPITFTDVGDLAKAGLDVTGAITSHNKGSNAFDVQLHINSIGNSKAGNSIYFLEGLPAFVDQPEEWAFDTASRTLWLKTDDGLSPASRDLRHK